VHTPRALELWHLEPAEREEQNVVSKKQHVDISIFPLARTNSCKK
jgi:hypothetical protein